MSSTSSLRLYVVSNEFVLVSAQVSRKGRGYLPAILFIPPLIPTGFQEWAGMGRNSRNEQEWGRNGAGMRRNLVIS